MNYKRLFILVEGNDDERFCETILKSKLEGKYDDVIIWKYRQTKDEKVEGLLKSIREMPNAEYIYVTDIDQSPCVTNKKQEIKDKFRGIDIKRIMVVIKEIESWYLAGLDDACCKKLKIRSMGNTDNVTKEQFNDLIPKKFGSRIDFMSEVVKLFSIEIAKQKNKSIRYFLERYNREA
jgi:hypothetical protein